MNNEFKHGFILDSFFNNYLSKINKTENYLDLIKVNHQKDKLIVFVAKNVDFIEYLYVNYLNKVSSANVIIDSVNQVLKIKFMRRVIQ